MHRRHEPFLDTEAFLEEHMNNRREAVRGATGVGNDVVLGGVVLIVIHPHYNRDVFDKHRYKSAAVVVPMLADIVSKNGNLMLSVPLQRDGQPDVDEIKIVSEIGAWLKVNGEAIYATRPWKIYGEGPSTESSEKGHFDGQKDVGSKPFTAEDIRFTQSKDGKTLYAIVLEIPKDGKVTVKSLAAGAENWPGKIAGVKLVGSGGWFGGGKLKFTRDESGLHVSLPEKFAGKTALALKIQ